MNVRKKRNNAGFQIQAGLVFLIVASLSNWLLQPDELLTQDWTDGITGLFYGVAFAFLLLGIWRNSRKNDSKSCD